LINLLEKELKLGTMLLQSQSLAEMLYQNSGHTMANIIRASLKELKIHSMENHLKNNLDSKKIQQENPKTLFSTIKNTRILTNLRISLKLFLQDQKMELHLKNHTIRCY